MKRQSYKKIFRYMLHYLTLEIYLYINELDFRIVISITKILLKIIYRNTFIPIFTLRYSNLVFINKSIQ